MHEPFQDWWVDVLVCNKNALSIPSVGIRTCPNRCLRPLQHTQLSTALDQLFRRYLARHHHQCSTVGCDFVDVVSLSLAGAVKAALGSISGLCASLARAS